jgi:putative urate catabolism protein
MTQSAYPRNMIGYGPNPPDPKWPNGARVAVQLVLNYEEGAENCVLHGDAASEAFLSEIVGAQPLIGQRHMNMESIYEYGSRVGVWRLLTLFDDCDVKMTVFAVGMAMERNPAVARAFIERGHEVASHCHRWIDYQAMVPEDEARHIRLAADAIELTSGVRPVGVYVGRCSPNTHRLVVEDGGYLYHSDSYADDLPYWDDSHGKPQLIVPYTLDANDMRFATPQGFNSGDQFFAYLRDSFDALWSEGAHAPKMMSIGLHCRLVGRPGRIQALRRFLDYVRSHDAVWICRRDEIARHWVEHHPYERRA